MKINLEWISDREVDGWLQWLNFVNHPSFAFKELITQGSVDIRISNEHITEVIVLFVREFHRTSQTFIRREEAIADVLFFIEEIIPGCEVLKVVELRKDFVHRIIDLRMMDKTFALVHKIH